jgi:hypothetical protein
VKTPQDVAARLHRRQIRAQRSQLVQPPTAATLPRGVKHSAKNSAKDFSPIEVRDYKPHPSPKDDRGDVQNPHKVPQAQWRKWDGRARRMFNSLFSFMMLNQNLFHHPKQALIEEKHWETVAHNAAWTAAEAVMGRYSGDEMGVGESARTQTKTAGKRNAAPKTAKKPPVNPRRMAPAANKAAVIKAKAGRLTAKPVAKTRAKR